MTESWHRKRFTAAHELAHYLFDRDSGPVHLDGDLFSGEAPVETRANSFAARLRGQTKPPAFNLGEPTGLDQQRPRK